MHASYQILHLTTKDHLGQHAYGVFPGMAQNRDPRKDGGTVRFTVVHRSLRTGAGGGGGDVLGLLTDGAFPGGLVSGLMWIYAKDSH